MKSEIILLSLLVINKGMHSVYTILKNGATIGSNHLEFEKDINFIVSSSTEN